MKTLKILLVALVLEAVTSVYYSTFDTFIKNDKTNEMVYVEDVFDCWQYTEMLVSNARFYGYDAYPVYAILEKNETIYPHAFVEIQNDGVIYWIEPQNDMFYVVSERKTPLCFTDGRCVADQFVFHVDYEYSQHQ